MSSNRRLKQSRTRDDEKGARTARSTGKRSKRARAEELSPEQRARCPVVPKIKFATDSSLEGGGFEPSVPVYGELRCTRARKTRHTAPS
jgi:hypothetical protein